MDRRILALLLAVSSAACASVQPETRSYIVRLKPGQELKTELSRLARENDLQAASIVSAVGSLTDVSLRLANQPDATRYTGHYEVVSLSGYLAAQEFHLHMAVSDGEGRTIGGHVMDGNRVYTTLVVVIEEHMRFRYRREHDPVSGYDELVVDAR
jgi:predicted DNA-binding protein with PD1-like motif